MPDNFKDLISKRSNIEVFKCSSQVFSAEGQKKNFGSYILLVCLAAIIGVGVFHFLKEKNGLENKYSNIKSSDNKTILNNNANPPKNGEEGKKDRTKIKDAGIQATSARNVSNRKYSGKIDFSKEDDYINFADYNEVKGKDKRSFLQTYWSYLKFKQSIIFTFYTDSIGILRSSKIVLFISFVAFYMAFTALFFNDSIMRKLYIYKGNTNAAVHVPNIILSSLCSFIASIIVRFVCLGERDIINIVKEKDKEKRQKLYDNALVKAKVKLYVLYGISAIIVGLCWYYVSAFCAVFKNSQGHYLINTLVSFIVCNLWPVLTSFICTIMRRKALEIQSSKLYKASKIVSIF
jgi:hypothetical protein